MRICYLCADSGVELTKYNGSAAHVRGLVGAFVELGHDVDLLMARTDGAEETGARVCRIPGAKFVRSLNPLARRIPSDDGGVSTTAVLRALRRIWSNSAVERTLDRELSRHRPDLIYERYSPFCVAGSVVARRLDLPHVLEVNAPLAWEGARHRGQAMNDAAEVLESLTFEASGRIVAVSDELREMLEKAGIDRTKILVLPNAVNPRSFGDEGPKLPPGLDDKIVVGFVGSLKAWHGVEVLVEAFAGLAEDPRFHLLVVGDGPMREAITGLESRCPTQVTFTGPVHPTDVPAYLRTMDMAVAPYPKLERFYFSPLKVLEYMASGTAVVASGIGQLTSLLQDEKTALLVEPGDPQALAGALRRLADDETLRTELGRRAADEIREHHGWTQRAERILELARAVA